MTEKEMLEMLLGASVPTLYVLGGILLIIYAPKIVEKISNAIEKHNDGLRIEANAKREAAEAQAKITTIAFDALQETMRESRRHADERFDAMAAGNRLLEDRVRTLERQLEERDERIEELERENKSLHDEIGILRKRLDNKQDRKAKKTEKGGDSNATPSRTVISRVSATARASV